MAVHTAAALRWSTVVTGNSTPPTQAPAPFRCKGLVYQGARDFYDRTVPGGSAAVAEGLTDPVARALFQQRFLAASHYDVLPIVGISVTAARLAKMPWKELVQQNAEWLARRDIHGVFRMILRLASPEMVALRLPRASLQYFAFGKATGKLVGPKHLEGEQREMPESMGHWLIYATEGFAPVALATAGAKDVVVRGQIAGQDGEVGGVPTVTVRYDITWT